MSETAINSQVTSEPVAVIAPAVLRRPDGKFLPGSSPNPGGRPRDAAGIAELARHYGPEALERLVAIMRDPSVKDDVRVQAIRVLLDRGYGKPSERTTVAVELPVKAYNIDRNPLDVV